MLITSRRAAEQQAFRRIDEIGIGRRHRREMSDLAALAASICDGTQLRPVVLRAAATLISGARRSEAGKLLGLTKPSVTNDRVDPTVGGRFAKCMTALPENYRNGSGAGEWPYFEIDDDCQF